MEGQGADNVYTQHTAPLLATLEAVGRCRLKDADYPFVDKKLGLAPPTKPRYALKLLEACEILALLLAR